MRPYSTAERNYSILVTQFFSIIYFLLGATTFAFFGDAVIVMIVFGPVNGPSFNSTVEVRSPLVKTKMLVFDFTALTVVQPTLGYSDWKNA
jgi:hypothetical protein